MPYIIIVLGIVFGLFVMYVVYSYTKLKNMPMPEDNENILILNSNNFNKQVSRGLFLVDFWAAWCGPCKMLAPTLNSIAETESDKIRVAKVNIDQENQLASKFAIRSIPTLVFIKDGKEIKRISGIKSKSHLVNEINKLQ